jgi:hypothetical protein
MVGEDMRKHYSLVIWGIVFVFFNFNIGPIDILPNFLGYIFIYYGLSSLSEVNISYRKGSIPSLVLAFVSLIFVFYPLNTSLENITPANSWRLGIIAAILVLNLVIFYSICKGIHNEAEKITNDDLRQLAEMRWKCMLFFTCISLMLTPFTLNKGQIIVWLNFFISIILIFLAFLIVLMLRTARDVFSKDIS